MEKCSLCPRACGADREKTAGYCTANDKLRVARAALHFWEEPPISGTRGSGTVFFGGCQLGCVFCQNREISRGGVGAEISEERLAEIFSELEAQGAHNINLVTPTHYTKQILRALSIYKPKIPVAVNTGGYEKPETVRMYAGAASIWMPDLKCISPDISKRCMNAPDYAERALAAIYEMHKLEPALEYAADGTLLRGVIVRHLVLPGCCKDSLAVLSALDRLLPRGSYLISLMSQFTPTAECAAYPEINRRVTRLEYRRAAELAQSLGMRGFIQEQSSSDTGFIPSFKLEGVLG